MCIETVVSQILCRICLVLSRAERVAYRLARERDVAAVAHRSVLPLPLFPSRHPPPRSRRRAVSLAKATRTDGRSLRWWLRSVPRWKSGYPLSALEPDLDPRLPTCGRHKNTSTLILCYVPYILL